MWEIVAKQKNFPKKEGALCLTVLVTGLQLRPGHKTFFLYQFIGEPITGLCSVRHIYSKHIRYDQTRLVFRPFHRKRQFSLHHENILNSLTLLLLGVINCNFFFQFLTWDILYSWENLAFDSRLRWKLSILALLTLMFSRGEWFGESVLWIWEWKANWNISVFGLLCKEVHICLIWIEKGEKTV